MDKETDFYCGIRFYSITDSGKMVSSETEKELHLLYLVKRGDPTAHKAVYSTYIRYLTAVCSRYIVTQEDVRDVLQESFLKIFSNIASFEYRGKGSLKGWLTKVTVNETLKFINRNNRIEFVEIKDDEFNNIQEENPDMDEIPQSVIFQLIRELPDGYRTIFNLYVIENKSHKEIASLLGIKESTSASQLHRAKSMLAAKIRQYNSLTSVSI